VAFIGSVDGVTSDQLSMNTVRLVNPDLPLYGHPPCVHSVDLYLVPLLVLIGENVVLVVTDNREEGVGILEKFSSSLVCSC